MTASENESFDRAIERRLDGIEFLLHKIEQNTAMLPRAGGFAVDDPTVRRMTTLRADLEENSRRQAERSARRREREARVIELLRAKIVELEARVDGDVALAADVAWIAGVLADYIASMTPRPLR